MPNKNYQKGRQFEYRVKKYLEENGSHLVIRSAGSHSPIDLVAFGENPFGDHRTLLVQCKADGKISKADLKELELISYWGYAAVVIAKKDSKGHIEFVGV